MQHKKYVKRETNTEIKGHDTEINTDHSYIFNPCEM